MEFTTGLAIFLGVQVVIVIFWSLRNIRKLKKVAGESNKDEATEQNKTVVTRTS